MAETILKFKCTKIAEAMEVVEEVDMDGNLTGETVHTLVKTATMTPEPGVVNPEFEVRFVPLWDGDRFELEQIYQFSHMLISSPPPE